MIIWTAHGCGTALQPSVKLAVRAWKIDGWIVVSSGSVQLLWSGVPSVCNVPILQAVGSGPFESTKCRAFSHYFWGLQSNFFGLVGIPLPSSCSALGLLWCLDLPEYTACRACVSWYRYDVLAGLWQSFGIALSMSFFPPLTRQRSGDGKCGFRRAYHPHAPSEPILYTQTALIRTQQQRGGESGKGLRPPHVPSELRPGGVGYVLSELVLRARSAETWVQQQQQQRGGDFGGGWRLPHAPSELRPDGMGFSMSERAFCTCVDLTWTQQQRGGELGNYLRPPHLPSELRPGGVGFVLSDFAFRVQMASTWIQQQWGGEFGNDLRPPHAPSELRPGDWGFISCKDMCDSSWLPAGCLLGALWLSLGAA